MKGTRKIKLTDEQVIEIIDKLMDGMRNKSLCEEYGVHRNTISSIARANGITNRRSQAPTDGKVRRVIMITKEQDDFINKSKVCMSDLITQFIDHLMSKRP